MKYKVYAKFKDTYVTIVGLRAGSNVEAILLAKEGFPQFEILSAEVNTDEESNIYPETICDRI